MLSILFYSTNWSKLSMLFFFGGGPFFSLAERPTLGLKLWRSDEIPWSSTDHGLQLDSIAQLVGGDKQKWWITEVLSTVNGKIMQKITETSWNNHGSSIRVGTNAQLWQGNCIFTKTCGMGVVPLKTIEKAFRTPKLFWKLQGMKVWRCPFYDIIQVSPPNGTAPNTLIMYFYVSSSLRCWYTYSWLLGWWDRTDAGTKRW